MSTEEIKNEEKPEPKQLTEIEKRAVDQGWVPQEEWDGDPDQWRPAREFIDRGELFKKIDEQNRTLKDYKRAIDDLAKHNSQIAQAEYKRALDDLRAQKKDALIEGDADKVIAIEEKMDVVRDSARNAPKTPQIEAPVSNPVFDHWLERNAWYNDNKAMRAFADRLGNELHAAGHVSPTDLLTQIEKEVKKEFAHKFTNPNRDKPGAVEGSTNKGTAKKDSFQLNDDERRVMQRFIRTVPGMTEEKYIADLKKIRGV